MKTQREARMLWTIRNICRCLALTLVLTIPLKAYGIILSSGNLQQIFSMAVLQAFAAFGVLSFGVSLVSWFAKRLPPKEQLR